MTADRKPHAVGIKHIALEVGNIDEALDFYGQFLDFTLRSKGETAACIDLGDQFVALMKGREQPQDDHRHSYQQAVTERCPERLQVNLQSHRSTMPGRPG